MARRGRRGEGTVYFLRSERRWVARYPLGVVDGRRLDKRVKCRTRAEADAELERLRRIYGQGGHPASDTLDTYLREWIVDHGRKIRPSTRVSYQGHIDNHIGPLLGGIALGKLAPRDVRRLVADLERRGLSAGTIHLIIRTLSVALNDAKADRTILDNPADGVALPRIEREPVRALTPEARDAIVDATAGTFLGPLVRLLLGSGLRLGEALGLDQGDCQLERAYLQVRRSKTRVRAVPISDDAVVALREAIAAAPRRGRDEPVFFGPRSGDRLAGYTVSHALPRILEAAGLGRIHPHLLRHGVATLLLADGVPMRDIAEQLGHRNPALTARIYAHVVPERQSAAIRSIGKRRTS
jgi:integrase